MAYFSNRLIDAAAHGPILVCIESVYPDATERLLVVMAGAPSDVDAERLAQEYGRRLYFDGERWCLAPLDST